MSSENKTERKVEYDRSKLLYQDGKFNILSANLQISKMTWS